MLSFDVEKKAVAAPSPVAQTKPVDRGLTKPQPPSIARRKLASMGLLPRISRSSFSAHYQSVTTPTSRLAPSLLRGEWERRRGDRLVDGGVNTPHTRDLAVGAALAVCVFYVGAGSYTQRVWSLPCENAMVVVADECVLPTLLCCCCQCFEYNNC